MNTQGPINSQSTYLPIEFDIPEDNKLTRELIAKRERLTASIVNVKENGNYEKNELLTGQQYFSIEAGNNPRKTRYTYRKTFDMVSLNGGPILAGLTILPHNIALISIPTRIFGTATVTGPTYLPLPYTSVPGNDIEINLDNKNININNAFGANLTQCYITFEWIKG